MTPRDFLWFRVIVVLVGLFVIGIAALQMKQQPANVGLAMLLIVGVGLALIAFPWRRDERHEPLPRHLLRKP